MTRSELFVWLDRAQIGVLHFALVATPLAFAFTTDELFEFNKMVLVYALAMLSGGIWIARMVVAGRVLWQRSPFDLPFGLFGLSQLLSTIFSIHPYTSLLGYYSRFHGGLFSVLAYFVLFYSVSSALNKKMVRGLLVSLAIGVALAGLYALPERSARSVSCLVATGQFDTKCWSESTNPKYRIFGTFGQPNWLAAYLVMALPLIAALGMRVKHRAVQLVLLVLSAVMVADLWFSKSRSGALALVVAGGVFGLGWQVWRWRHKTTIPTADKPLHDWKWLAVLVGLLVTITLLTGTPFTPAVAQWFNRQSANAPAVSTPTLAGPALEVGGTESGEIRRIVWQGAINIWRRYPIFGSGVETFAYSYYQDRPLAHNLVSEWDYLYNKAHNEFLNFLATTGVVGFLTYLFMTGVVLWVGARQVWRKPSADYPELVWASLAALVGVAVSNFFGFSTVMVAVMTVLCWILVIAYRLPDKPTEISREALSVTHSALLVGIALLTLFGLIQVKNYWEADRNYARSKSFFASGYYPEAVQLIQNSIQSQPFEATFTDELAEQLSLLAAGTLQTGNASAAAQLAAEASQLSQLTLQLNSRQLNFYKSRIQLLLRLQPLDPTALEQAEQVITQARLLSPTDPKLVYTQAVIELAKDNTANGIAKLSEALQLKPNYLEAGVKLAEIYLHQKKYQTALEIYDSLAKYYPNHAELNTLISAAEASAAAQLKR